MWPPLPYRCCYCGDPMVSLPFCYFGGEDGGAEAVEEERDTAYPPWTSQLLAADFHKTCARDRVCHTCTGAAFCAHCCGEHHRGHVTSATTAADDDAAAGHRRDSFCTACRVAFCSELCAHHEGHEVIPVDEYDGWRCVRCTGFERCFQAFHGVQTFEDEHGNLLVPLQPRPRRAVAPERPGPKCGVKAEGSEECPAWLSELVASDFYKTCARDHVCNTCAGAAFCWHCCGEHHRGHDRVVDTEDEVDGWAASVGHRRDSFCIVCRVAFSSELCAHHEGHEIIPIDAYGDRHFMRSTGSEPWFSVLGGIETYEDEDGNLMVPLERKRSMFPEPGLKYSTRHHG